MARTLRSCLAEVKLIHVEDTRHDVVGAVRKAQRLHKFNERQVTKRKF